ncbi:MAG: ATP-binding protein [Cyclobacteriaceae bacterium]|nr:ATP-binding protein [Cyclobacteriaceae bacterium]
MLKLLPFVGKPIIKVLMGQRRVGKSYILQQLRQHIEENDHSANIIYINKELEQFAKIRNNIDLSIYVNEHLKKSTNNYLFIDEVQEIVDFQHSIRDLFARDLCDIYLTGSNSSILSGELATLLSGRYVAIEIHCLNFHEFLKFHQLDWNLEALMKYMKYGGLPFLHHIGLEGHAPFEYLKNVYSTIILNDVIQRAGIRNVPLLQSLTTFLADNVGSLFSATNIHKYLKSQRINLSVPVIINYLHALCNAFIVHKVPRSDVKGLKIFEIGEKYYFEDIGLRNIVAGENSFNDLHKLLENLVFIHLKQSGFEIFVGKMDDKEIDFVAIKKSNKMYVQIALTLLEASTREREFGNLMSIEDNFPKYVVTLNDPIPRENWKGIERMNILEFLKEIQ